MSVNQPNLPPPIHIWEEDEYECTTPLPSYIINVPSAPKKEGKQERDIKNRIVRTLFFPRK